MNRWLMKSEPDTFGIDHLAAAPGRTAAEAPDARVGRLLAHADASGFEALDGG